MEFNDSILSFYRNRTILVTGGAGAIGSNLVRTLAQLVGDKGRIIILDNLSASPIWNVPPLPNVMFVEGDVRNDISLKRVFNEKPSIVYHLAAFFANQNSVDYPEVAAEVDISGLIKVLTYSRFLNVERFVYASSGCAIYGAEAPLPYTEEFMSMHLTTPYQINKMTGEMYCNFFHHNCALPVVKPRFFNSYGPGEVPGQYRNVIPNFIYWAMRGQPLPITGEGRMTRDFTYVGDLVNGLVRGAYTERAIGESFNLASGVEIEILELAKMINEATGNKAGLVFRQRRAWDTKSRLLASIDKASGLIGYKPQCAFEEGLKNTVAWFRENWDRIQEAADFPPGMSSAVRN
jgi:nucleoside-diphosphate-sugar epimerase